MKSKLLLLIVPFLCFGLAGAQEVYKMDMGVTVDGVLDADTLRIDKLSTFDFYYENSDTLAGYSTGFRIWSDNGVEWDYDTAILKIDWIQGTFDPMEFDTTWAIVSMVEGSRQDPVGKYWDQSFEISLADTTGADGVDSIMWGGMRKDYGLYPGPLERQAMIHFHPTAGAGGTLCIDSNKVGLAGDFIFVDIYSYTHPPVVLWPEGGRCWPVRPGGTAADDGTPGVPFTYGLGQNYPNPFNPVTMISYSLARKSNVKLVIFNVLGQNVKTLVDGEQEANNYEVVWDGDDNNGAAVASGVYFYKLIADEYIETKKMLLMR